MAKIQIPELVITYFERASSKNKVVNHQNKLI